MPFADVVPLVDTHLPLSPRSVPSLLPREELAHVVLEIAGPKNDELDGYDLADRHRRDALPRTVFKDTALNRDHRSPPSSARHGVVVVEDDHRVGGHRGHRQ